jgi:hypothetical protein
VGWLSGLEPDVVHWVIEGRPEPDAIVAEARARGVRSLVANWQRDLSFLRELPALEFLWIDEIDDPMPLYTLRGLRFLSVTCKVALDLTAFQRLEWLGLGGPDYGTLESVRDGHPALFALGAGEYSYADLEQLGRLRLTYLKLGSTRKLVSLAGIEALGPSLARLELDRCPNLDSLDGIEALDHLEYLELSNLPRITTLDWVRSLSGLRFLNVFDLKGVESLGPLAGHPTLEFVNFGRIKDLDLDPLTQIPNLKLFNTGFYRWNRDTKTLPYFQYEPAGSPRKLEWTALSIG